jgi:hypothetical protein
MSAATGLARQEDGFDKLLKLATLKAEDIKAAGEENRRQMQLTQEEHAKVAAAKSFIAKHAELESDLRRREEELASSKSAHEKEKSDFAKHVFSENIRLETLGGMLGNREKAVADSEAKLSQAWKELSTAKSENERQYRDAMAPIKNAENANIEIGKSLEKERQRLTDWESTLKGKAERIRQQAASF